MSNTAIKPIRPRPTVSIWLGNLAKYNDGILAGKWLALPMPEEDLKTEIKSILGSDEEYHICDYESDFEGIKVDRYDCPYKINELAEKLDDLNDHEVIAVDYLLYQYNDIEYALDNYENVTVYQNMTLSDVVEEWLNEGIYGDIPDDIRNYLDTEAMARDLGYDGYDEFGDHVCHYHN